mmetsp:Transcript_8270/g.29028  ORF Transcript_8270/g.29028 Transcript_8270/m.29028 type:complete len:248 (-) Transcript_8270:2197-2940(-)|eukprot:CAMPEP_0183790954 /NCGR_PEP_ID=MMETSP0803_2-20130417/1497_1 /TAXON_ID=195967 /ORGANISM="Crustomastix stigmata, Strain CCMP3273" /LENGTH=247 /DNA_ID=CAMNT_0026035237 /DNA_START=85 /DNA_END=828 /DNA_ORIENTATION=+
MADNKVSWEEAQRELQRMFPEVDIAVIDSVLEAHGGHVEGAVETLLGMQASGGSSAQSVSAAGPSSSAHAPRASRLAQVESDELIARRLQAEEVAAEEREARLRQIGGSDPPPEEDEDDPWNWIGSSLNSLTVWGEDAVNYYGGELQRNFDYVTNLVADAFEGSDEEDEEEEHDESQTSSSPLQEVAEVVHGGSSGQAALSRRGQRPIRPTQPASSPRSREPDVGSDLDEDEDAIFNSSLSHRKKDA